MGRKNTSRAAHLRALRRTLGLGALIGSGLMAGTSARADTLYLCKAYSGGLFWTNGRCADQQALIERIVSVPPNLPFKQQVDIARQSVQQAQRLTAPPVQQTITQHIVTTQTGPDPTVECQHLSATITNLDNQARLPQTAQMQEWLSQQKRNARDRQFRLGC